MPPSTSTWRLEFAPLPGGGCNPVAELVSGCHGCCVAERIHDDEIDTTEETVRRLLADQCSEWSSCSLSYLRTSGTDNAMWRVHVPDAADVVVRLPRRGGSAKTIGKEVELLRAISDRGLVNGVATPRVRHVGDPIEAYPHRWAVLDWLDGADAWTAREDLEPKLDQLALDLADTVHAIGELSGTPASPREPGERGGPIALLLDRLDWWLDDPRWNASQLVDVGAVKRRAAEVREVSDDPVEVGFVHGDLIPGNLLTTGGRLTAIIDWSSAAYADRAQDLSPAWAVFHGHSRDVFREAVGADDAAWLRASAFELEHAVGGVLYYTPRRHPLADVMARTLGRLLQD